MNLELRCMVFGSLLYLVDGILAVRDLPVNTFTECFVLQVPFRVLLVDPGVDGGDVRFPGIVLRVGKVLQVGDLLLASVVLRLGEVVQGGDLALSGVVFRLGPLVQGSNLRLPGGVLGVELALQLGNVGDPGLVVLLLTLLQGSGMECFMMARIRNLEVIKSKY